MRTLMVAMTAMLTGCATVGMPAPEPGMPRAIEREAIRYETTPCHGTCPVYTVTIGPDGRGSFTGTQFTAVTGTRDFTATPAQYRAFAARLAPFRPANGEVLWQPGIEGRCTEVATDMPSIDVQWTSLAGDGQHLNVYLGCDDDKHRTMADALRAAPGELPIAALIGRR